MEIFIETGFFNPELTLTGGQAFRWVKKQENLYFGIAGNRAVTAEITNSGIKLIGAKNKDLPFWQNYFDIKTDYDEIIRCFSQDEILRKACKYARGLRHLRQEPFETLISFIISQNNNITRIRGIIERLCALFGEKINDNCFAFPTAKALAGLSEADLAPLKAGYRARYIIHAAETVEKGEVDLNSLYNMQTDAARRELLKITGVGEKVADCVLLFAYRKATFPKDVWIKRAMSEFYPNGLPPCTAGFEGIANQYLFEYIRNNR